MANESSDGHSAAAQAFNLVLAYALHLVVGLPLVLGFAVAAGSAGNAAVGWVWGLCALALWVRGAVRAARRRADLGAARGSIFAAWLLGALGPIGAAAAAYSWFESSNEQSAEEPVNPRSSADSTSCPAGLTS
jgi:hypothetical protein